MKTIILKVPSFFKSIVIITLCSGIRKFLAHIKTHLPTSIRSMSGFIKIPHQNFFKILILVAIKKYTLIK